MSKELDPKEKEMRFVFWACVLILSFEIATVWEVIKLIIWLIKKI